MYVKPSMIPADYHERMQIFHAITRPLEDVTVSEICRTCGISRKKFYALFSSKYEVTHWYLDFCFSVSLYEIGRTLTWHEGIAVCLELVKEERAFFLADYLNFVSKSRSYYWPLDGKRKEAMLETLRLHGISECSARLQLEIALYSQLVPDLIRYWLQSDEFEDADEYALLWEDCVPRELHASLEL